MTTSNHIRAAFGLLAAKAGGWLLPGFVQLGAVLLLAACTIEPPLHLEPDPVEVEMDLPIVITDMETLWEVDTDWRTEWYYGWDETDELAWGALEYPNPTSFQVRRYFTGDTEGGEHLSYDPFTVTGSTFRRKYNFGYYDMLIYSNIDSRDNTQTVLINESDPDDIWASTTSTRVSYKTRAGAGTLKQPEIFYSTYRRGIFISDNTADYDYFDEQEGVWVKRIQADLRPVVYIYLVQVILHNNHGRVTGVADEASIDGLTTGVNLHTLEKSEMSAVVTYGARLKTVIDVQGEECDIIGGRLNTYGLCPLSDSHQLSIPLSFRGGTSGVVTFDVSKRMQARPQGGVITVHLDVDEVDIPTGDSGGGTAFIPTVNDYNEETYEFEM